MTVTISAQVAEALGPEDTGALLRSVPDPVQCWQCGELARAADDDLTVSVVLAARNAVGAVVLQFPTFAHKECCPGGRVFQDVAEYQQEVSRRPSGIENPDSALLVGDQVVIPLAKPVEAFVCPVCHKVSHHPDDVAEGYCGNCHSFTGERSRG